MPKLRRPRRATQPNTNPDGDDILIIGIDSGTTSFKTAYMAALETWTNNKASFLSLGTLDAAVIANFPGYSQSGLTNVSTSLIYDERGTLLKWGHGVTNFLDHDDFDPDYLVNHWKFGLHDSALRRTLTLQAERLGKEDPVAFIEDFFKAWGSYLFEDETSALLKAEGGDLAGYKYIDIVIPVPPGWSHHEHELFAQAATRGLGPRDGQRIFLVSETECVLRSWMQQGSRKSFSIGDVLLLLDLGAGTACVAIFLWEVPDGKEGSWTVVESHSLTAGSEVVTDAFVEDFKIKLQDAIPQHKISKVVHRAREQFNKKKMAIGSIEEDDITIDVRGLKRDDKRGFHNTNKMIFSRTKVRSYLMQSLEPLFQKIEEVIMRISIDHGPPKFIVAAGAYARNELFQKMLEATYQARMKIFYPENPKDLVAKGACLARVQGEFRQHSGNVYSIGSLNYAFSRDVKKLYPKAHTRIFEGENQLRSPVIDWPQRRGRQITENLTIDHYGKNKTVLSRAFEPEEEIRFTEKFFVSDHDPGTDWTHLEYSVSQWDENERNLRMRNIPVRLIEFDWDLSLTRKKIGEKSYGPFTRADLREDNTDGRLQKRVFVDYRPLLKASQVEWRVCILSYYPNGQVDEMPVGVISMGNIQQGSIALSDEYATLHPGMRNMAERALNFRNEYSISGVPSESSTDTQSSPSGDTSKSGAPQSWPNVGSVRKRRAINTASPTPSPGMSQTTEDRDSDFEPAAKYVKDSQMKWRPCSQKNPVVVLRREETHKLPCQGGRT